VKALFKQYAERIDNASLRERVLLFLAAALALVFVVNAMLIKPLRDAQRRLISDISQNQLELRTIQGEVQRLARAAERGERLQQQRRLADAGIAADQRHLAGHQPAAEHAIQLGDARCHALHLARLDPGERHRRRGRAAAAACAALGGLLAHRAGLAARGTKAHPLQRRGAAF